MKKSISVGLIIILLMGSCAKSPDNPDTPTPKQSEIDSVIYTRPPASAYDSYRRSVYTFESDSLDGYYKINRFDSVRQYNNVKRLHYTELTFWFARGTDKLVRIYSKNKFRYLVGLGEPFSSDFRDNYEVLVSYINSQSTPTEILFKQYNDSTSITIGKEFKFTRDYLYGIDKPILSEDTTTGIYFHTYLGAINSEDAHIAINLKDSIYVSDNSIDFRNWLLNLDPQNIYKPTNNSFNIFPLNKNRTVKSFVAVNFEYQWVPIDPFTSVSKKMPLFERKIDFSYDDELTAIMESLISKKYLANLALIKMLYPNLGIYSSMFGHNDTHDRHFIYQLKTISNTATDSLLYIKDGRRDVIHIRKTTSSVERDDKGRISTVYKFESPYNVTEKFEFIYKK